MTMGLKLRGIGLVSIEIKDNAHAGVMGFFTFSYGSYLV